MFLTLLDLPPELIGYILSFVSSPSHIVAFSSVNRQCRELTNLETLWQQRCREDYPFSDVDGWNLTYKALYTRVLHQFGSSIGLWQLELEDYGGLIDIKFEAGCIHGRECLPPVKPNVNQPMRMRSLFTIKMAADRRTLEAFCHRGFKGLHKGRILWRNNRTQLCFQCTENDNHRHPDGKQKEFEEWLMEETGVLPINFFRHDQDLPRRKFRATTQLKYEYRMTRLPRLTSSSDVIIQPGLFKGNYGGHGNEIIQLSYCDSNKKGEGRKISGDPNVPAGKVSVRVDMTRPMVLAMEQQTSIQLMGQIDIPELPPDVDIWQLPTQPFHIPDDCYERFPQSAPTTCRARFHGEGQIAGDGFTDPSMSKGHFIVFDNNNFGFLWLELWSFSMYSRVTDLDLGR